MPSSDRVYLDHAATSWPKSEPVLTAMDEFARHCGAAAGRGAYASASQAGNLVAKLRRSIVRRIGGDSADSISFHANGTAALNAAIHGLVRPGDHVVVTAAEHNSVLRPLHHLSQHHGVELTVVEVNRDGRVEVADFLAALRPTTRLACVTHASNVTGAVQPVKQIGEAIRPKPTWLLCDAAQTFGSLPVSVGDSAVDVLVAPGHKSIGGPLGTAFLYLDPSLHEQVSCWMQGGTGSESESLGMPSVMPSMLEAGNLNVPALAGLAAAVELCDEAEVDRRRKHACELAERLRRGLAELPHLSVHGPLDDLPIASVTIDGLSPADAAMILDGEFHVEARSGLHCAALIHGFLGTQSEGTLRLSAGHSTSIQEIDVALDALREIVTSMHES